MFQMNIPEDRVDILLKNFEVKTNLKKWNMHCSQ